MNRRNFIRTTATSAVILAATPVVLAEAAVASASAPPVEAAYGAYSLWTMVGHMNESGELSFDHYYPADKPEEKRFFSQNHAAQL